MKSSVHKPLLLIHVVGGFLDKHRHSRSNDCLNVSRVNLFLDLPRAPEADATSQIESATEIP